MAKLTIAKETCKGCGLCIDINAKGYHPVAIAEQEKCIGCAFCARMCPDAVITVEK